MAALYFVPLGLAQDFDREGNDCIPFLLGRGYPNFCKKSYRERGAWVNSCHTAAWHYSKGASFGLHICRALQSSGLQVAARAPTQHSTTQRNTTQVQQPKNRRRALVDVLRLSAARETASRRRGALRQELRQHLPATKGGQPPNRAKVSTHLRAQAATAPYNTPGN